MRDGFLVDSLSAHILYEMNLNLTLTLDSVNNNSIMIEESKLTADLFASKLVQFPFVVEYKMDVGTQSLLL